MLCQPKLNTLRVKITIIADYREKMSGIPDMLAANMVHVVWKQLNAGDYLIDNAIVIERKTSSDFVQSVINGRLFNQCAGLRKSGAIPLIIIEGNPFKTQHAISAEAIKGALLSVSLSWQIPIIRSSGKADTAQFMVMASKKLVNPPVFIRRKGVKPRKIQRQQHYLIQGLPGIGPALACRLLLNFKTIEQIVLADVRSLANVEGIGKNKATAIYDFFRFPDGPG